MLSAIKDGKTDIGTSVIMRYTLRLLSLQQFERAASMICAAECIRKQNNISGNSFRIGLWAGQSLTPNKLAQSLQKYINQVKIVHRLREVNVLCGFRRVDAYGEEGTFPTRIAKEIHNWLPATELLGEGIFIEFNLSSIYRWESGTRTRYEKMYMRAKSAKTSKGEATNTYVMIHTFSHLLIRELAMVCGYDTSAIKERLYVDDEKGMAGVLLYTASASSDGSLGGLAREGSKDRLESIIVSMLERARWCSNDPICIESLDQGYKGLNYAACHACCLLPESSCQNNNILLDRCALVGTGDESVIGFLEDLREI